MQFNANTSIGSQRGVYLLYDGTNYNPTSGTWIGANNQIERVVIYIQNTSISTTYRYGVYTGLNANYTYTPISFIAQLVRSP